MNIKRRNERRTKRFSIFSESLFWKTRCNAGIRGGKPDGGLSGEKRKLYVLQRKELGRKVKKI